MEKSMNQDNSEEWIKDCKENPVCPNCGADSEHLTASIEGIWNTDMKDWSFDYFNIKLMCDRCDQVAYYKRS